VASELIAALGDDLRALLWHGSWARGEQTEESDHDMIVVLKRAGADTWERMRHVFEEREAWSVYVKTEEELRQYPLTGRLQFHHGNRLLFGEFEAPPVTKEGLIEDIRRQAVDIGHEARYRLIHEGPAKVEGMEPRMVAARGKRISRMLYYQAKLGVLAMKSRELCRDEPYPESRRELRERLSDPAEVALVDVVDRWPTVKAGYEKDFRPLARLLDEFVRGLVRDLDREESG
jgi:predicted nucleotidyltransferase